MRNGEVKMLNRQEIESLIKEKELITDYLIDSAGGTLKREPIR